MDHLAGEIMAGRMQTGERLPAERVLAETYGLSRPTVREALRGLQERGLVEIIPARGTFVRTPTTADAAEPMASYYRRRNASAREVIEARLMLETFAARLAAQSATDEELEALRQCMTDCEAADNLVDRAQFDIAFHGLIARASHNAVIETMFASIAGFTFELMLRSLSDPTVSRKGLPYHRHIVEALLNRDADAAEDAVRGHLSLAGTMYGADYDRSIESVARRELQSFDGSTVSLDKLLDEVGRRFPTR
jgi:GntR family transcriptional repressor for pyruvate dehydrogenase complex